MSKLCSARREPVIPGPVPVLLMLLILSNCTAGAVAHIDGADGPSAAASLDDLDSLSDSPQHSRSSASVTVAADSVTACEIEDVRHTGSALLERMQSDLEAARLEVNPDGLGNGSPPPPLRSPTEFEEWLDLSNDADASRVHVSLAGGGIKYRLAFATPIMTLNIRDALERSGLDAAGLLSVEALARSLSAHAMETKAEILAARGVDDNRAQSGEIGNERTRYDPEAAVFDAYQRRWPQIAYASNHSAALRILVRAFKSAVQQYFKAFGLPGEPVPTLNELSLNVWQSVQNDGSSHGLHDHTGARTCGVFFAQVPEGSGPIKFHDPRPRSPFMYHPIVFQPTEGDIVVFPPWLVHEVLPSTTTVRKPRVSFSFNESPLWAAHSDAPRWLLSGAEGVSDRGTDDLDWSHTRCAPCEWVSM